jgi:hypothetical protein
MRVHSLGRKTADEGIIEAICWRGLLSISCAVWGHWTSSDVAGGISKVRHLELRYRHVDLFVSSISPDALVSLGQLRRSFAFSASGRRNNPWSSGRW